MSSSSSTSKPLPIRANFRANYLEKIGGLQSEATRLLDEQIAGDLDVDRGKLAQFAIKYDLPAGRQRIAVWKLLLGISSCYPESKAVVAKHRSDQARQLLHSLCVMRIATSWHCSDPLASDVDIVRMIQLDSGRLPLPSNKCNWTVDEQAQLVLATQILGMCGEREWIDAFWLTKNLDEMLAKVFSNDVMQITISEIRVETAAADSRIASLFTEANLWDRMPLQAWLRTGCASLLSAQPLHKLWDKLCTGEGVAALLKTVVVGLICTRGQHLQAEKVKHDGFAASCEMRLPVEVEEAIVARSIQLVSRSGKFVSRRSETKMK